MSTETGFSQLIDSVDFSSRASNKWDVPVRWLSTKLGMDADAIAFKYLKDIGRFRHVLGEPSSETQLLCIVANAETKDRILQKLKSSADDGALPFRGIAVVSRNSMGNEWTISHFFSQDSQLSDLVSSEFDQVESHVSSDWAESTHSGVLDLVNAAKAAMDSSNLRASKRQLIRFIASLQCKRFLIVTGLSGSGKTKLAQAFARWITPNEVSTDVFTAGAIIKSERVSYYVKSSDSVAVEFWNSESPSEAVRVVLPREMIQEWSDCIQKNGFSHDTSAREIRDIAKLDSAFSDQLHSFETHLKAAAFALLDHGRAESGGPSYAVVPVGADWMGSENVLGYPNGLDNSSYVSKPSLDLAIHASKHPDIPHLLILDEMNLSHVERYFADLLSAIESGESIPLHQDNHRSSNGTSIPSRFALPENLFIIGTVNVDETTYMFSPKVLDRANVIEFRITPQELEAFVRDPTKPDLRSLDGRGKEFGRAFVESAKSRVHVPQEMKARFEQELQLFFKALQEQSAEFGYRVAHDAARLIYFLNLLGESSDSKFSFADSFDLVIAQKLLPKLHGSRAKLGPLLKQLWFLCTKPHEARGPEPLKAAQDAGHSTEAIHEPSTNVPQDSPYPISAEKIGRMWRLLADNGFTSFAEA